MNSAICTLFEGHYHYGVAALSNSLYHFGFRGNIYVGYRGPLPSWTHEGIEQTLGKWTNAKVISPCEGLKLIFLELDTNYSLTNYKPDFMLELWQNIEKDAEAFYYFDPDIILTDSWKSFEVWAKCGVAVAEDINSPIPEFHPQRIGWRDYFKNYDLHLKFKSDTYVNGGFIGLTKKDMTFLTLWKTIQEFMGDAIGGLENSIFSGVPYVSNIPVMEGFQIFAKSDQDALNATIEVFNEKVSFIGSEVMGFKFGHNLMIHALGIPKPWKTNMLSRALNGQSPRITDITYWKTKQDPILVHSKWEIKRKKMSIYIAKFINRLYKA